MGSCNQGWAIVMRIDWILIATLAAVLAPRAYAQAPRTPWGDPDLQGIWSNPYETPLERPERFGTRAFLTDEEVAEAERSLAERYDQPGRDSREGTGTERDVARAYNEHWRGDPTLARGRRTSMIVDPADGQMPALTAEAQARIAEKTEFLAALLQGTSGGRPGPISPRRSERSPDYNLDRINR
ncbi:MAG: hypothetical protein OEM78_12380, partial [Gammaproteobacteria bacterium]|nr:hypothetical protein [Gammaproteobacteria bacterium]